MPREFLDEAFITLFGLYYLLDMDYPTDLEKIFYMIQWIIFEHRIAPKCVLAETQQLFDEYELFKI